MFTNQSRQVRRAHERAMLRKAMTATERRKLFRKSTSERKEIYKSLLSMILSGELRLPA
jgi:hypothetical protein